ncbi:ribosomal subunit interface protein [Nocardia callitridis]|uniref:HPF/RaiA family ribosome-associated protein n=1 Tax=Nocardia callitridis TaxID=648753 RepID=A0ABP9L2L9_9NOCA
MEIDINTGNGVRGDERLIEHVRDELGSALARFEDRLTWVQAHLSDQNGDKGGPDDKQCVLEARPVGGPSVVVTHRAGTVEESYLGAAASMTSLLDSRFGKLHRDKGGESIRHPRPE